MDEIEKCHACGSTLAANGECPDCGTPEDEDDELNDYVCWNEQEPTATRGIPVAERPHGAPHLGSCRVLPFPRPNPAAPDGGGTPRRRRRQWSSAPARGAKHNRRLTELSKRQNHAPSIRTL